MKAILCVDPDGVYRLFRLFKDKKCSKEQSYNFHKTLNGYWYQDIEGYFEKGIAVPEHCFATNLQNLNPGEGPIVLE